MPKLLNFRLPEGWYLTEFDNTELKRFGIFVFLCLKGIAGRKLVKLWGVIDHIFTLIQYPKIAHRQGLHFLQGWLVETMQWNVGWMETRVNAQHWLDFGTFITLHFRKERKKGYAADFPNLASACRTFWRCQCFAYELPYRDLLVLRYQMSSGLINA